MKTQDLERANELAQEQKETRWLIFETSQNLKEAAETAKALALDVSGGRPGARIELDAAKQRQSEIETRAKSLNERLLALVDEAGNLGKWDMQARAIARDFSLGEEQIEQFFELLKSGKSRAEVAKFAARLSSDKSAAQSESYSFQTAGDVAW
jgi:hypothetical protein